MKKASLDAFKFFFLLIFVLVVSFPASGFGQEGGGSTPVQTVTTTATTTSNTNTTSNTTATTTNPVITVATTTATSTLPTIPTNPVTPDPTLSIVPGATSTDLIPRAPDISGLPENADDENTELDSDVEDSEEENADDFIGPLEIVFPKIPLVPKVSPALISERKFNKEIVVDAQATHLCEAEKFRVDITNKQFVNNRLKINLGAPADTPYELEIGGLPKGVDVAFEKNFGNAEDKYIYKSTKNDPYVDLKIKNVIGAQKGDFNISVIFTKKISITEDSTVVPVALSTKNSSVICQINIVNR